jgi:hypothetical protein
MKLLDQNLGEGFRIRISLVKDPNTKVKIDKRDYIKLKSFCTTRLQ